MADACILAPEMQFVADEPFARVFGREEMVSSAAFLAAEARAEA